MVSGVIFDGVDVSYLGLEYAPEQSKTYVYNDSEYKIIEENFDGKDGSYYYGNTVQPKDFELRFFFEETHVNTSGNLEKILRIFSRGRTGKLVFKDRPWCYYTATVRKCDVSGITNYLNGIVKVTLRAHYPFARSEYFTIGKQTKRLHKAIRNLDNNTYDEDGEYAPETEKDQTEEQVAILENNTGMLHDSAAEIFRTYDFQDITEATTLYIYNPGSEMADCRIEISGDVGNGVIIRNETTGQECKVQNLTSDITSGQERKRSLAIDSLNGKVYFIYTGTNHFLSYGYFYHDYGFIKLAGCAPMWRDIELYGASETHPDRAYISTYLTAGYYFPDTLNKGGWRLFTEDRTTSEGDIIDFPVLSVPIWANGRGGYSQECGTNDDGKVVREVMPDLTTCNVARFNTITISPVDETDGNFNIADLKFTFQPTYS